ncbi:hypothetical protein DFJ43DRAFT_1154598 [Lentinula guzmanii]|uniref:Nucleic acid-binding protein n=1 Tax=Lentinula guzmanii TaxID=2804957 RepID=A0AA38MZX3_9AGAR|nr:hypothetical protein DFJ43DRAFT_1154598 [Lentinula guzmanii]
MSSESNDDSWSEHLAKESARSIRHVSIRQLLKAELPYEKALFTMDKTQFKTVVVVGNILQKTVAPNQIAYKLDDGSGHITARFWRDPTQGQLDSMGDDSELRFVRAVGELNEFKSTARSIITRSLLLQSLEYIEDPHEVFYHIAHIIVDTQTALHGQPPVTSARPALSELSRDLQELDLKSPAESIEDEELTESVGKSVDANNVLQTPAKVRNARNLSPPSPTPRPRSSKRKEGHAFSADPKRQAEAGSSKSLKREIEGAPTTPKSPQGQQSVDLEQIILSIISDRMRTLRMSRPAFAYEGVRREDVIEQVLKYTQSFSLSLKVNDALRSLVDRADIYETVDENHFDLLD